MKKYSKNFERDWKFYCDNRHKFNFCGCTIATPHFNPEKMRPEDYPDAKEAFFDLDSKGIYPTFCNEPNLFVEILACKKAINLQIKSWAQGYLEACINVDELLKEFIDPPDWVREALINQISKIIHPHVEFQITEKTKISDPKILQKMIENKIFDTIPDWDYQSV